MNFHLFALMHAYERAYMYIAFVYNMKRLYLRAQTKQKKRKFIKIHYVICYVDVIRIVYNDATV